MTRPIRAAERDRIIAAADAIAAAHGRMLGTIGKLICAESAARNRREKA